MPRVDELNVALCDVTVVTAIRDATPCAAAVLYVEHRAFGKDSDHSGVQTVVLSEVDVGKSNGARGMGNRRNASSEGHQRYQTRDKTVHGPIVPGGCGEGLKD